MSRAERQCRIQRQMQELRAALLRLDSESYTVKLKLEAIETEFALLAKDGES